MTTNKCPCCGYYTSAERYSICPVCFWENDGTADADEYSDCNGMTLGKARENYSKFGACSQKMLPNVRPPREEEMEKIR